MTVIQHLKKIKKIAKFEQEKKYLEGFSEEASEFPHRIFCI